MQVPFFFSWLFTQNPGNILNRTDITKTYEK
jgi:hypothetical protein